jgi:predicted phosphodiesterase
MNDTKKAIILGDIHYPLHHQPTLNIALKYIKHTNPSYLVLAGDQLDFNSISTFNTHKPRLIEGQRLKDEYEGFQRDVLNKLDNILDPNCKKFFMIGNHELRSEWLGESTPSLTGMVEPENCLELSKYKIVKYNDFIKLGKSYIIHGQRHGVHHSESNLLDYNENIFSFHCHQHQEYSKCSPIDGQPKIAVSVGCMCNLNPHYLKGKPNNWTHEFLVLDILPDGTFHHQTPRIINDRTIIDGKLYIG